MARRAGLVGRRLRAEFAVLGAGAGLGVDDGAEVDLVALELLADAVGGGEQVMDVGAGFCLDEPDSLISGEAAAVEHARGQCAEKAAKIGFVLH
jgi:hypothetical protein